MTNTSIRRLIPLAVLLGVGAAAYWILSSSGGNPAAIIRVVDAAGKPVEGAVIIPEGLRTKAGPYQSGCYGWPMNAGISNSPVRTGNSGTALIPYPKYVFERIETGVLRLKVDHPEFVADHPECVVDISPPAGAPFLIVAKHFWDRICGRALTAQAKPIVLNKGGILQLSVCSNAAGPADALLFAQVNSVNATDNYSWSRPAPNLLITRRLASGRFTLRAVKVEANGTAWFSEVISDTAVAGKTNSFETSLRRGVTVRGTLDATVPRPVHNGHVIAQIWPTGFKAETSPPEWHSWAKTGEDGRFEIPSLPPGDLELVALCDGFMSTNGQAGMGTRSPQKHLLGTNDIEVVIGMEPTARLEVTVTDDKGKPLKDAKVVTWPNVTYGGWSSTIFGSDCYNSADCFSSQPRKLIDWQLNVPGFQGTTDAEGRAVLFNVPPDVKEFSVSHSNYALPAITAPGWFRKQRHATVSLIAGETNRTSVKLEPRGQTPISHY